MTAAFLLAALLTAAPASQQQPPPLPPGAAEVPVRVERRLLVKKGRVHLSGGATYLSRGDYYVNPGLLAAASYYPGEEGGLDVRFALFFSSLGPEGTEVFERTGLVPDAHRPVALLAAGWRHSLGYGKVLLGSDLGSLVHFDVQLASHLGLTFTDRSVSPSLLVGPALLLRFGPQFHVQLDVPLVGALEQRSRSSLSFGVLPTLTLGAML
jgi:hypothetical protein